MLFPYKAFSPRQPCDSDRSVELCCLGEREDRRMSGLHPQYMLSKRFPVHAAIELQDLQTFASLLCNKREASYHFDRKLTNTEVSTIS